MRLILLFLPKTIITRCLTFPHLVQQLKKHSILNFWHSRTWKLLELAYTSRKLSLKLHFSRVAWSINTLSIYSDRVNLVLSFIWLQLAQLESETIRFSFGLQNSRFKLNFSSWCGNSIAILIRRRRLIFSLSLLRRLSLSRFYQEIKTRGRKVFEGSLLKTSSSSSVSPFPTCAMETNLIA